MSGEIALDTSVAVRFLNGDPEVVSRVLKTAIASPINPIAYFPHQTAIAPHHQQTGSPILHINQQ